MRRRPLLGHGPAATRPAVDRGAQHEALPKVGDQTRPGLAGAAPAARSWKVWAASGFLVVAVGAAYANSFRGPFVFDDLPSIVTNQSLRNLGSPRVLTAPPDAVTTTGRPIVNLSLAINYAIGGLAVEGYHVVNLVVHVLAALVLFGLLRRTLLLPTLAARFSQDSTGLALAVALLWAVHPLQTESVTYIVQRAEAIAGLLYLLALYCLVRGATAVRGSAWYAAAVGSCALGMASKEVMVSAPLFALLYDRIFISGSFKKSLEGRWRWWLALAATWVILPVVVHLSQDRGGSAGFGLGMTAWEYARTQFGCIIRYLRLAFWPSPLVLDRGNGIASDAAAIVPYAIGVFLLVAATAVALALRPKWGFLGAAFFAVLAPTSSIVPLVGQTEAEHRMYLPLAAVVTLVVLTTHGALAWRGHRFRRAMVALVAVLAGALALRTFERNKVYQSAFTIWDDTVRNGRPNHRAYNNRGNAFMAKGEPARAIADYDKAIELKPGDAQAYGGRGSAYSATGRYDEAMRDYDQAIKLKPDFADAYHGRGSVYAAWGQIDAAIEDFDRALALDPYFDEAYSSRGRAQDSKGQYDAAIRDYDKAIALRPDLAEAYNNRGGAYEAQGQVAAAIKDYDKAIALKPDLAEAYSNRGNCQQRKGQHAAAIKDYDKAITLQPDLAPAYYNRAMAQFQIGNHDQAWADVRAFRRLGGRPSPAFIEDLAKSSGRSE